MANRGCITDKINEIAKEKIGREITQEELRLMAYVQYRAANERTILTKHINHNELSLLGKWEDDGFIKKGFTMSKDFRVTKEFWDFMCEVLYYAYHIYDEEKLV